MKTLPFLFLLTAIHSDGAPEKWTDASGRVAEMELVSVSGSGADATGVFRLKDGKEVMIAASKLSSEGAKKITEWKPSHAGTKATFVRAAKGEEIFPGTPPVNSATYSFRYSGKDVIGIRKNSLSITSCALSKGRKTVASPVEAHLELGSHAPIISDLKDGPPGEGQAEEVWELSSTLVFDEQTNENLLQFDISLNHGKDYLEEDIQASKFSASVMIAIGRATTKQVVQFKKNEMGKKNAKAFGPCRVWLEELQEDPFADPAPGIPMVLHVFTEEPSAPGLVKSCELLADGKPIRKLEEVASSISVSLEYWSKVSHVLVQCDQ